MPAALDQNDLLRFPHLYTETEMSNAGVVVDPEPLYSTSNTVEARSQITPWESLALLNSCTQWFNSILRSLDDVTSNKLRITFTSAQAPSLEVVTDELSQAPTLSEQIATIRSSLSLQIKEIADALAVKRPTVYSWINGDNSPHPTNRERLRQIYRLAQHWNRLSDAPLGDAIHAIDERGTSVFDLLRHPSIPTGSIIARLRAHASARHAVAKPFPMSVRELARKHSIDLTRLDDRQGDIDLETGKPFSTD